MRNPVMPRAPQAAGANGLQMVPRGATIRIGRVKPWQLGTSLVITERSAV